MKNKLLGMVAAALGSSVIFCDKYTSSQELPTAQIDNSTTGKADFQRLREKLLTGIRLGTDQNYEGVYREYVSSLELESPFFNRSGNNINVECDESLIRAKHEEILDRIKKIYQEEFPPTGSRSHAIWQDLDYLVKLDAKLALCKYKNDSKKINELMQESADHFESVNRFSDAARIYYSLQDQQRARAEFLKNASTTEEVIRLTPSNELSQLVDYYLRINDHVSAGKVEWFRSNKERAIELIFSSEKLRKEVEKVEEAIRHGGYWGAVRILWRGVRLPFYKEIMIQLCRSNGACLDELNKYKPLEDFLVRKI